MIDSVEFRFNKYRMIEDKMDVEIYLGQNEREQDSLLFIISKPFPHELIVGLTNTDLLSVFITERFDGKTIIAFDLQDSKMQSVFSSFANNMVTFILEPENIINPFESIILRYSQWQKLLKKNHSNILSVSVIRGLIGELLFIADYLIPKIGVKESLNCWTGILGADQDFRTKDTWYEVKTVSSGKDSVTIASVDQLDTDQFGRGNLLVYHFDSTTTGDPNALTIDTVIAKIKEKSTESESFYLDDILFSNLNYYDIPEYKSGEYVVRKSSCIMYQIDEESPVLRKKFLPNAVVSINYELSLASFSGSNID